MLAFLSRCGGEEGGGCSLDGVLNEGRGAFKPLFGETKDQECVSDVLVPFLFLPLQSNGSLMWCQNHKQCSKVTWPSPPFSFRSERDALLVYQRTPHKSRRDELSHAAGVGASRDVDTGASEGARSHSPLPKRRHYAQSSKISEESKSRRQFCDSVIVFPELAAWNFQGGGRGVRYRTPPAGLVCVTRRALLKEG